MALNDPSAGSAARKPIARITAMGLPVLNWRAIEVLNNAHYVSDTWRVALPLSGQPAERGLPWWSTQTDIEVAISAGLAGPDGVSATLSTLVVGLVDTVEIDPIGHDLRASIVISGRDYSGVFIDSVVTKQYEDTRTASEIVAQIVAGHPGIAAAITPTTAPVQSYYDNQGGRLVVHQTEWDFMTALAEHEGFQVLMQGKTLYFGPPVTPDLANPYDLLAQPATSGAPLAANVEAIRLVRNLTLARDVIVIVESFDSATGQVSRGTATATNKQRAGRFNYKSTPQIYTFNIPNLTAAQAQQQAEAKAQSITRFERVIEATLPGDPALSESVAVRLSGTGTDFDQIYHVDRLRHRIDAGRGYTMELRAKNHSTYSTLPL